MFTIFDEEKEEYIKVVEPDLSLNYTYADYWQWKFKERLELIRGRIFKMGPSPGTVHQRVNGNLMALFHNFLRKKKCSVYPGPFDVRLLSKDQEKDNEVTTVIQPDISIVCDESKIDERGCCGAPDLVVEVLSPGNSHKEVKLKFELYEEARVKEYWIVHPAEETLIVFILDEYGKYSNGGKMYAGNDKIQSIAVPGLIIDTEDIFTK